jgi:hypothetical protein
LLTGVTRQNAAGTAKTTVRMPKIADIFFFLDYAHERDKFLWKM